MTAEVIPLPVPTGDPDLKAFLEERFGPWQGKDATMSRFDAMELVAAAWVEAAHKRELQVAARYEELIGRAVTLLRVML